MKTRIRFLFFILAASFTLNSCNKEDDIPVEAINKEIFALMKDYYYWNWSLPASIDASSYPTPDDLLDALRYEAYDRWSIVLTKEEFSQYFEEGIMVGHGFMMGLDNFERIRIAFVYPSTQAYAQGVRRGWIVSKVNGIKATADNVFSLLGKSEIGVSNTITFLDETGSAVTKTLTKEELDISPVLHHEVLERGGKKIGYLVFQDFIETANEQLDEVFAEFTGSGVDEVIVDMRYNGGGSVNVAEHLASWLIGKDFGNQPFIKYEYNADLAEIANRTVKLPANPDGLSLDRIFFIGTSNTASASEMIINGVKPYVESVLAGSATHGKPVGMIRLDLPDYDYVLLPICFKYSNADGEGDFYDGLQPALAADDDITRDFGNPEEASLKAILDYIETGFIPHKITKSTGYLVRSIEPRGPLGQYQKAL